MILEERGHHGLINYSDTNTNMVIHQHAEYFNVYLGIRVKYRMIVTAAWVVFA
jgi:hypothetical protein